VNGITIDTKHISCGVPEGPIQINISNYMLNAPPITHVGYKEFKFVCLLPVEYRVDQLKLGRMYNVINGSAPDYKKK